MSNRKALMSRGYQEILTLQNGVCAICGRTPSSNRKLSLDHDHSTGKFRGLLCVSCNTLLGLYENNAGALFYYLLDYDRIEQVNTICTRQRGNPFYSEKKHCPQGHTYEGDNLRIDANGHRTCIECQQLAMGRYRARKQ